MPLDSGFLVDMTDLNKFPAKYFTEANQWIPLSRELSQAELQVINSSPVTLVLDPAANEYLRLIGIHVSMDYNDTAWVGADLIIQTITTQTLLFTIPEAVVEGRADFCKYYALANDTDIDIGEGIEITSASDFTANGSNIKITFEYRKITI